MKLFVIVLRYIVEISKIDEYRSAHLKFLDEQYAQGRFIVSGRQAPVSGGIIMARAESRRALKDLLKEDPFWQEELAEYSIYEFTPTKYLPELEFFKSFS